MPVPLPKFGSWGFDSWRSLGSVSRHCVHQRLPLDTRTHACLHTHVPSLFDFISCLSLKSNLLYHFCFLWMLKLEDTDLEAWIYCTPHHLGEVHPLERSPCSRRSRDQNGWSDSSPQTQLSSHGDRKLPFSSSANSYRASDAWSTGNWLISNTIPGRSKLDSGGLLCPSS